MLVLIINMLILMTYALLLSVSTSLNKRTERFALLSLAFVHLLLLHTFFDATLFPDLDNYYYYFNNISNPYFKQPEIEMGWKLLNKTLYSISHNNFILLFTVSFAIIGFYITAINRHSRVIWLSVIVFVCLIFYNSLFVLRQHLAMGICAMTFPYIIERQRMKFLAITLLAVSFHSSALIWLLSYVVFSFKLDKWFFIGLVSFAVVVFFSMKIMLDQLVLVTTKIMMYTAPIEVGGIGVLKALGLDLFCIGLSIYSFGGIRHIKGYNKLFFQLILVSLALTVVSFYGTNFTLFGRLNLYFAIPNIFLLPNAVANLKSYKQQYLLFIPAIIVMYTLLLNATAQYGYTLSVD